MATFGLGAGDIGSGMNAAFYNRGLPQATTTPVSPFQTTAINSNISSLPDIRKLTEMINEINAKAYETNRNNALPGRVGLENQSTANIASVLGGNVPRDVINQLGQQSAERGVMTGSPGGPSTNADYLRSLGLTSLDLMGTGQNWFNQATARNPGAPLFDPSMMLLTPAQQAQIALEQDQVATQRLNALRNLGGGGFRGGYSGPSFTATTPTPTPAPPRPDLIPPPPPPNRGGTGTTSTFRYGPLNTGGHNWFDDLLWDNATPVNSFDPSAGNWFDDPFGLG